MKRIFITVGILVSICSFGQSTTNAFNDAIPENNIQFFESSTTSKPSALEKHRIWLNMTNTQGAFKQLLVGYIEGATNGYDSKFDGITLDKNPYIDFYSINLGSNLVIQGRALPFNEYDAVPLGYRSIIEGEFTISIDQVDGMFSDHPVYLEDKVTNTINDLRDNGYTFTTATGVFNNRFVLRYTNKTLDTDNFVATNDVVSIGIKNQIISVHSTVQNIDKISVYSISGQQLSNIENIRDTYSIIQDLPSAQQILVVKVLLENGKSITKKALFQ
ncbi:T9SS sorting signal type C domain-containing protein [Flavobacterium fluviatile]|uniref:T9SS sorting signal type C domain-containing protein n=1 Tax=Flavobacterium fluviatile TaxID=1862387 RepID=UPI0013D5F443|nr:T9SS sorting signal type C domain-containing protein [Flavobacterium fluviatile]